MNRADEYRNKAEECLQEAATAPAGLRLGLITIAQRWFELAEAAARIAAEGESVDQTDRAAPN